MGFIRRLDTNVDIQSFPGAHFEAVGDIPAAQCSEAQIEGDDARTLAWPDSQLIHTNKFIGWDLTGKTCTVTVNVGGNVGDFLISSNVGSALNTLGDFGDGNPTTYYVHDGGELILTRDTKSFAQYIHAAGYAYTIKAGKLYTDMPNGLLKNACTILWNPQT